MGYEFYPLNVGNFWKYKVTGDTNYLIRNKVIAKKVIQDQTWYMYVEYKDIFWVRNDTDGHYEAIDWFGNADPGNLPNNEQLLFKYPLNSSMKYKVADFEVEAVFPARTVTTPAGQFQCILYKIITDGTVTAENCITPGIGVVWSKGTFDGETETAELIEYHINKNSE